MIDKLNLVYDSWDDENDCPLLPNCRYLYVDGYTHFHTTDYIIKTLEIEEEYISRYKLSDIEKYPNKKFFYFITLTPNLFVEKILNNELPLYKHVIEYWKSNKNLNIILMEMRESEDNKMLSILDDWTKKLKLNQRQLYFSSNNERLIQLKNELSTKINVHSSRNFIREVVNIMKNKIDFKIKKDGLFFLCLNNNLPQNRYSILLLLKKYNILDDVNWSLLTPTIKYKNKENLINFLYFLSEKDIDDLDNEIDFLALVSPKRSIYEENKENLDPNMFYEKDTYENAYVNIVTETAFLGNKIHITEKSFKPFLALQFPLILATKDHIKEIKKTYNLDFFDDIINHDYDDVEDPRERLFRFFDEVKRIHDNKDFFINFYINNKDRFIENQNKIIRISNENYDKNFLLSLIKNENI